MLIICLGFWQQVQDTDFYFSTIVVPFNRLDLFREISRRDMERNHIRSLVRMPSLVMPFMMSNPAGCFSGGYRRDAGGHIWCYHEYQSAWVWLSSQLVTCSIDEVEGCKPKNITAIKSTTINR